MPTVFPGTLDSFINPQATDSLSSPAVVHHVQHGNANDAITAIESKVGIDNATDTKCLDYKMSHFSLYGVGNTTQNSSTVLDIHQLSFDGLGGLTVGFSNGSVQLSGGAGGAQSNQTIGFYGIGNTTQNSSTTLDARTVSFDGLGGVTVGFSNGSVQISGPQTVAQSNQSVGLYGVGNTTQNSSTTLDARTISFDGLGGISVGFSNGSVQISGPQTVAQTNQTAGWYGVGNTTQNSSTTFDDRTISIRGNQDITVGFSNGSVQLSVNVTSAQSNQTAGLYAVGNTTQNSSTTLDARTLSFNGLGGISVGFSNGSIDISGPTAGGGVTLSEYEPYPLVTGTAFTSNAAGSIYFHRFILQAPLTCRYIALAKTMNCSVPGATSVGSSGTYKYSYSHGLTFWSRQDYANSFSNLTTVTTASIGFTASLSYTSTAQSAAYSWVTDTTGGTTSFSTTSNAGNWSSYFTGNDIWSVPFLTSLSAGEWFVCHQHSSTTASGGNSGITLMSFSNFNVQPTAVQKMGVLGQSGTAGSLMPGGAGQGTCINVTTTTTMGMNQISNGTLLQLYMNFQNCPNSGQA